MAVAGALAGEPIRTVKGVTDDLDVPADAEIVIEGLIDPELLEPEGPFGESHGHVALEDFNMSMQVTAITHRRKPVCVSIISQVTPSESCVMKGVAYEPLFLSHLRDTLAIKGMRRVVMHEPLTNVRPVMFVQFAPGMPQTEIWRGLHGAASLQAEMRQRSSSRSAKTSIRKTPMRCSGRSPIAPIPIEDVQIAPYRVAGPRPEIRRPRSRLDLLIDATLKEPMPPFALPQARIHGTARRRSGRSLACRR